MFNGVNTTIVSRLGEALKGAEQKVYTILPKIDVVVKISEMKEKTIPEIGISGRYIKSENTLYIWVDSTNKYFLSNLEEEIVRTFAHEYAHAYREQIITWEHSTLLEAIVSEGLSQSFEIEVLGINKPSIYTTQLSQEEIKIIWESVLPNLHDTDYDYNTWFFGSKDGNIKRWTGYSLGFWLVQSYIKKTSKKASELLHEKAESFLFSISAGNHLGLV